MPDAIDMPCHDVAADADAAMMACRCPSAFALITFSRMPLSRR